MKIAVPETKIARTRVERVDVGEIKIGAVHVGQLLLSDLHVQTSTGLARMRNVRLALHLEFELDWRVGVTISMPDGIPNVDFSDSGTLDLGTLDLAIQFGDLTLPGLANLSFDIASLPVNDLAAVIGPIKNLNLGTLVAEQIRAQNLTAPTAGFTLSGLNLGGVHIAGLGVPAAGVANATVGRVTGGALPIPALNIPNIGLPQTSIPTMSSQDVNATANPIVSRLPGVDIGLLAAKLKVTTTASFHLDELRLDNLKAAAAIGNIALKDVVLPYEVLGVTLSQIGIETLEIPQAEVN